MSSVMPEKHIADKAENKDLSAFTALAAGSRKYVDDGAAALRVR